MNFYIIFEPYVHQVILFYAEKYENYIQSIRDPFFWRAKAGKIAWIAY